MGLLNDYEVVVEVRHTVSGNSAEDARKQAEFDVTQMVEEWYADPAYIATTVQAKEAYRLTDYR